MYNAIFLTDKTTFDRVKTQSVVVEAYEPFNMVVIDSADKLTVDVRKVKNTLTFSDIETPPTNKAIITLSGIGGTTAEAASAWLSANKVTVIRDLFNFGIMIVELPRGTFDSFSGKVSVETWCSTVEEDVIAKVEPYYAFTYNQHWHLGNVEAQEAWGLMSPYASNTIDCNQSPVNNFTSSGSRDFTAQDECCAAPEVAILDAGVQTGHPDLFGRFGTCGCDAGGNDPVFTNPGTRSVQNRDNSICTNNWNIVDNNANVEPQNSFENHATAVAGIISANNLNNNYTLSVSNNYVRMQVLKIGYPISLVSYNSSPSWTLEALYRAAANPSCAAIVIPLGATPDSPQATSSAIASAIEYVVTQARNCTGIPIFAAAGNNNSTTLPWPANNPYVMAIGGSTSSNVRASWSNKGADVFAGAPGVQVRTTDRTGPVGYSTALFDPSLSPTSDINFTNFAQTLFGGTSASVAIVAGIAGSMRAVNPAITAAQIKTIFEETSLAAADLGAGIVRMQDAIQAAIDLLNPVEDLTVDVNIISATPGTTSICSGAPFVIVTEVEGSGDTWNQVTSVTLEYFISNDQYFTSNDFLLDSHTFPVNNTTNTYTWPATIPNNTSLIGQKKLFVRATFGTNCGQIISDGAQEFVSEPLGIQINSANCLGTDLSIQILSVSYPYPTNPNYRLFQYRYTNTGTVPISAANITRGWIGGSSSTININLTGATQTTLLQPGQSRIINQTYSTPAPQWPGTFYTQINTVNGGTDFNTTNNYATISVNQ